MTYSLIEPPIVIDFHDRSKSELTAYYDWFMRSIPHRLKALAAVVRVDHPSWSLSLTADSLDVLGDWLNGQIEVGELSDQQREDLERKLELPFKGPSSALTMRSLSLTIDSAMYFSQVVLSNVKGTEWTHVMKNKRDVDYGLPVIVGSSVVPLNPVRILRVHAYKIVEGTAPTLRAVFDAWARKLG